MIRQWCAADQTDLARLWCAAWQITMPAIDFTARLAWFDRHIGRLRAAGVIILCAVDAADQMVGFATIDPATGEMDQLAVAPDGFGAGIATALLAEVKRRAPERVWLLVNTDNARAVRFYTREGFRVVGTGVNPNSGFDILNMEWS